jgi:hypothetical protein
MNFLKLSFFGVCTGILSIVFVLSTSSVSSQEQCKIDSLYTTNSVESGGGKMDLSFGFFFIGDSVFICKGGNFKYQYFAFKIVNKECVWDEQSVNGSISMNVTFQSGAKEKNSILRILFTNRAAKFIEIEHKDIDKRVFSISRNE